MKKWLKRILLVIVVVIILAQIPFIYRRYQTGQLSNKISERAKIAADTPRPVDSAFKEYKGVIHAHTSLGGHSTGSFDELIKAANANDLDFVLMTEHYSDAFDTSALTLNGFYGKTLFIGGNELDTKDGDRFLLIPGGGEAAAARTMGTAAFLEAAKRENKLALITYPEKFKSWDSNIDGIEVFSLHTAAKQMSPLTALGDLIWSYPSYPELTFAESFQRPDANLQKFDEIASQRKISLFAGTDAHSDLGFHLIGDDGGHKLINIKLDSYETIFRIVRLHVRLPAGVEFNRDTLIMAIRDGTYFVGLDAIGDTTGFVFRQDMTPYSDGRAPIDGYGPLRAIAPMKGRFIVFKNGEKLLEEADTVMIEVRHMSPGVYRVEVYRDDLGPPFDKMPWIISNPIYVR